MLFRSKEELKSLFCKSMWMTVIVSVVMTVSAIWLSKPLSLLFVGYDLELCDMTITGMKIYSLSFLLCGVNIFGSAFFTALNDGISSAVISILRTFVIQIIAILVLPMLWGIYGIWFAIVIAEALTLFVTIGLFIAKKQVFLPRK